MAQLRKFFAVVLTIASLGAGVIAVLQKPHLLPNIFRKVGIPTVSSGREPTGTLEKGPDHLVIGSFNIQAFGESKLNKPQVMEVLVKVARQFDVLAIQEVRAKTDIVKHFVDLINSQGARYDFVIGPRLGRTTSKEQYAVIYDTQRVVRDPNGTYTVNDPNDRLHREPMVTRFRAQGAPDTAFSFTLINIHTDPDEVKSEVNALDDVFQMVQQDPNGEDDVILLGDLNADERHFGELGRVPAITWAISGVPTNVRGDKTYDNILFDAQATSEYNGKSGVYVFAQAFGLSQEEALQVSDHCPVWAQFSAYENRSGVRTAARPVVPR